MMFTIDLLKGKGLPRQVDIKQSALKALLILVPVLAVMLSAAGYQSDRSQLKNQQQQLIDNQQQIQKYTKDMAEFNQKRTAINNMEKYLNEISKAMAYRIQVSDLLVELVQKLPANTFIYEIDLDRNAGQEKVQRPNSGEIEQKLVVRRNLNLILCGYDADQSDAAVQNYINHMKESPLLAEVFTQINPPTRQQGQVDGRPAVFYEIECALREQTQ